MGTMPYQTETQWRLLYPNVPANESEPVKWDFPIYYSPNVIENHAPGRKRMPNPNIEVGPSEQLQDGISLFDIAYLEIAPKEAKHMKIFRTAKDEQKIYECWICYSLMINGPDVEFVFDVPPEQAVPYTSKSLARLRFLRAWTKH